MITLANADAALKDYYLDAINAQLNAEVSPFYNAIAKSSENVFGKDVKMVIAKSGMDGIVAGAEDDTLPAPRANRYYHITVPLKNLYGTIEISDKAIRASENSAGAFVNILNAEMEGLVASAKANLARMIYSNGSGLICRVTSKSGKIVGVNFTRSYFKGLTVSFGMFTNKYVIEDVNPETNTITLSSVVTEGITGGETVYISSAPNKELMGLSYLFDNSVLYGYPKNGEHYFRPYTKHIKPSELAERHIVDAIDAIEENSDSKVNMILCSHNVRKRLASLMTESRRIVNTADIAAGYSSIVINDVPVYADKFCPDDRVYLVNTNDFVLCQLCDWSWLEDEDGRILKQVPGKAAYSATLVKYAELICKKPCGQGAVMLDMSE